MATKKRPTKSPKKGAPKRPAAPTHAAEPEGGPFARRRAFLEERLTPLGPKTYAGEEEGAAGPGITAGAEGMAGPATPTAAHPAAFRKRAIGAYRKRQEAEVQRSAVRPGARRAAELEEITASAEARVADEAAEDQLLGPVPQDPGAGEDEESGLSPIAAPPTPPAPPPANNWIPLGPSVLRKGQGGTLPSTSGRCNGIAVASGGTRLYAAAANGGVWRSDDEGRTWRSLMDAWDLNPTTLSSDSLACGSIAIDPTNADRIFVGSGDGNEATFFGVGPVVSTDGGVNWSTEPIASGSPTLDGQAMNAITVDPNNADRVVAGTFQGVYRRQPRMGGGFEWQRKTGPSGAISSVVVAQSGGTTTFFAAPFSGPVFSSNDGDTWAILGTGFPTTDVGRVGLAVRPSDPSVVYALVAKASDNLIMGVYRLFGAVWKQVSGAPADLFGTAAIGGQGTYDLAIAVDPNNSNLLYFGGSTKASNGEWSGSVYRSSVTSSGSGAGTTFSMTNTFIGNSVHADIHCFAFAPGDSNKLWLGCDGGVYYSTNPTGSGDVFSARNTGLQTMTMNRVDHHPTEDAVVFAGTQDNGGARFTGEEAWYHSVWGDCGEFVINWNDPYRVLATYVRKSVNRTIDGGTRYNYSPVNVPAAAGDGALFYAPLAGTPPSGTPAEANRVAFGARRVWISETFGGSWQSIPNNSNLDDLGSAIRSLRFASATRLYAGTMGGRVYRFTLSGGAWTRTRIDNAAGGALGLAGAITSIAIDPADATGDSIYISFGGAGDFRHVWHFNGTAWAARSGPAAADPAALLDVQHNAIVCDPSNPGTLFVGADIGVWRSTNGGANWAPFSSGLPDAAVLDLDLHNPRRLLRASTYGRGVWEYNLDAGTVPGVELYVRDTQLDQGRFATVNFLNDPTSQGNTVRHWAGPDIRLDTPDGTGTYQFPITPGVTIDFEEFTNVLNDDTKQVATHATANIVTRVYAQVHNRGVTPADNVRVMCLLSNASAGLPPLPAGFAANAQAGNPINTADWKTIGFATLNDVRPGFPKIASFELNSSLLPPPSSLAGNDHHCVLALVHHNSDQFTATQTITDLLSIGERKSAHRNLKVVEFTGTLPPAAPIMMAVRIHNPSVRRAILTSLVIRMHGYKGKVRMYLPAIRTRGEFANQLKGLKRSLDMEIFTRFASEHIRMIERNQQSRRPYNREWSMQRIEDVHKTTEARLALNVTDTKEARINNIYMPAGSRHTIWLAFERPQGAVIGNSFPIDIIQVDAVNERIIGGLNARIDITKAVAGERPPRAARAKKKMARAAAV
jgi:hypothetical protein